ncbi:MAG: hypothetical protein Harvfovirus7_9 [Harvfovirus sp.]|uniref:Uncharacterized protein n=1 Tax=Harvfovirus sp. TaxID=2487768 RepID=A0A3G5A0W2_9VIRU|nr:MAG: hypothetical protein Harvfovirus7_9 [Harvfovirus sp.]
MINLFLLLLLIIAAITALISNHQSLTTNEKATFSDSNKTDRQLQALEQELSETKECEEHQTATVTIIDPNLFKKIMHSENLQYSAKIPL